MSKFQFSPQSHRLGAQGYGRALGLPALLLCLGIGNMVGAADNKSVPKLSAAQIVEKHIEARGGLPAWHGVTTMSWSGKMEVGAGDSAARSANYVSESKPRSKQVARTAVAATTSKGEPVKQVQLPFLIEMKRPEKSRIEIEFDGKTSVQVFDGKNGWLVRPYLNRNDAEPFTADQAKAEAGKWELDGPLLDYSAKGTKVDAEGVETVDNRPAYKLKLTAKDGSVQRIWIDSQTFLDVKVEGTPRRMDGRVRTVWVYQRDFRRVQGLMVPFQLETSVDGYQDTHKMFVDKVTLNPALDDALFAKPKS